MYARGFSERPADVTLRFWYTRKRYSLRKLESLTGASMPTIRGWLKTAGLRIRTVAEAKAGQKPAAHTVEASVRTRRKRRLPGRPTVGYKLNDDGYVLLWKPGHPMADGQGYVKEHRLVLAQVLGRMLLPTEDGHHKNHVRHDNRPSNLELKSSRAEHQREHSRARKRIEGRFAPG